jgi:hypothetical protein
VDPVPDPLLFFFWRYRNGNVALSSKHFDSIFLEFLLRKDNVFQLYASCLILECDYDFVRLKEAGRSISCKAAALLLPEGPEEIRECPFWTAGPAA